VKYEDLKYIGYKYPSPGDWYVSNFENPYEILLKCSTIQFLNVRFDCYRMVEVKESHSLADHFDEWNW